MLPVVPPFQNITRSDVVLVRKIHPSTVQLPAPVAKSRGPLAAVVILPYCVVPLNNTLPGELDVPDVNVRVMPIAVVNPPVPV